MITWVFMLKWAKQNGEGEWRMRRIEAGKKDPNFILELPDCENVDKFIGEGKELDRKKTYYFFLTKNGLTKEQAYELEKFLETSGGKT